MKYANRFMLPLELFCALFAASIAMGILFSPGPLWVALDFAPRVMGVSYRNLTGVPLLFFALTLFIVALYEWVCGRRWGQADLLVYSQWRQWCCFFLAFFCVAIPFELVRQELFWQAPIVGLNAFWLSVAFALAWYKAARLSAVLNPDLETTRLERDWERTW